MYPLLIFILGIWDPYSSVSVIMNATLSQLSWDFSTLYLIKTLSITASSDASSDGRYNVSFNGKALLASLETNYMNLVPKSCDEKSLSKPLQKEALRRKYSFIWTKELSTKMEHKLSMNDLQTFLIAVHMNEFIY